MTTFQQLLAERQKLINEICGKISEELAGKPEPEFVAFGPCSFCVSNTTNSRHKKYDWFVCADPLCNGAAAAQVERIEACLLDSPETRADALRWFKSRIT